MKRSKILALGAVAVMLAPVFAMASSLSLDGSVQTSVSSSGHTQSGSGSVVDVNANANTGTHINTNSAGSGDVHTMSGVTQDANGTLMIMEGDSGNLQSPIVSSANVSTDSDFATYAQTVIHKDATIKEVDTDVKSIAVRFEQPGRFVGIFPVTMSAIAKVNADGGVTFSYPWYHFLTSSSVKETALRDALSTQAAASLSRGPSRASLGATSTTEAATTLSASEKAHLLDTMRLVLNNALGTNASANASGTASATY